jgi:hypothetical protein
MALITFTSDYGLNDHYVAAIKAKIFRDNPNAKIIDITHKVPTSNLIHASFILASVFQDFPEGSIHLIAVNSHGGKDLKFISAKMHGHFFVLPNNGLLSLMGDFTPEVMVELPKTKQSSDSFPEKSIMAKAAAQLSLGSDISNLGTALKDFKRSLMLQPKAGKSGIFGHVIHVDSYGNLITNIRKNVFEDLIKMVGPGYEVVFSKWHHTLLNNHYGEVDEGEIAVFFNDMDYLEIAIRFGNASQLFGMKYESSVRVSFEKS